MGLQLPMNLCPNSMWTHTTQWWYRFYIKGLAKQHQTILQTWTHTPATLRVLLFIGVASAVVPLHCTTVPFSLAVAVDVRVEVISATLAVGLAMFVRVATKLKSAHCKAAMSLQSKFLPMVSVFVNWMWALRGRNGSTIQSRTTPWLTVQM